MPRGALNVQAQIAADSETGNRTRRGPSVRNSAHVFSEFLVLGRGFSPIEGSTPLFPLGFTASSVGRFPIPSVEKAAWSQRCRIDAVETAGVDADFVRIRPRHIERVHTAMLAESVLCRVGVELIRRELVLTPHQLELLWRDDQMQNALLRAYGAVAFEQCFEIGPNPEPHCAAMTAALVSFDHPRLSVRLPVLAFASQFFELTGQTVDLCF